MLYAFGNVEASLADQFCNILKQGMVVAMHVNPLLIGLVLGIKTLRDGITDPVMAWITDYPSPLPRTTIPQQYA